MSPVFYASAVFLAFGIVFCSRSSLSGLYQLLSRRLGWHRLPDYAKLTGVPVPRPLYHFDIDRAKPRPYRPFRWEYHQTMCMSLICSYLIILSTLGPC